MLEIYQYNQEKFGKTIDIVSRCDLRLYLDYNFLCLDFDFSFKGHKSTIEPKVIYNLEIDSDTGNFEIGNISTSSNDFQSLKIISINGLDNGAHKIGFWGIKYREATIEIFERIREILQSKIDNPYIANKKYKTYYISPLFDLIVDFHLYKKEIKFHDNVYYHILQEYPLKKFLIKNENKFLPAILDEYRIKTKYFVGVLSSGKENNLNLISLRYLCHLFGDNFIDYIKKIDWINICKIDFIHKKLHICETESDKRMLIKLINNATTMENKTLDIIKIIYDAFELRNFFLQKNFELKFKFESYKDLSSLIEEWILLKNNINKGYVMKHLIPDLVVKDIEKPIVISNKIFRPKVLLSENDFILEGIRMKNCMGSQFIHGSVLIYISLSLNGKKINLQFDHGELKQSLSRNNLPVKKEIFGTAIEILKEKIMSYKQLTWITEKILL